MGNVITEYSILLASKKKPVLHKQYGCGGTSIRRHGKEDAQVAERRCGLPYCYYEMLDWVSALFENRFARLRDCLHQKVQMKRSETGGEAEGCCPQKKSPCPTLVGRRTKAEKADWEGFRFNIFKFITFLQRKIYSLCKESRSSQQ